MAQLMGVEDLSGVTLGKYYLIERLGKGAMGVVYRAYGAHLKREVAVKVLLPELAAQPDSLERFEREAEIAARLEHPHIIPVYDYDTQEGVAYIVMRLLNGRSLEDRHKEAGALPLGELARLLDQQASALDYAHAKGVIHRDVKASNVMLGEQGHSYLSDFGIAKLRDANSDFALTQSLTQDGVVLGTFRYLAPERWEGKDATPASDIYALGVLVYFLLTGRLPFEAGSVAELMRQHLFQQPAPVQDWQPKLSNSMNTVLRTALKKEPQKRYPDATAFAADFRQEVEHIAQRRTTQQHPIVPPLPAQDDPYEGETTPLPPPPLPSRDPESEPLPIRRGKFRKRLLAVLLVLPILVAISLLVRLNGVTTVATPPGGTSDILTQDAANRTATVLAVAIVPTATQTSPTRAPTEITPPTQRPEATFTPVLTATVLPLVCPYSPPSRLVVGGLARVIAGQAPNIIREAPNTASARLGEIPAGQILSVLDGPQCGPTIGRMWWRISYQGTIGWTTEGSGDTYFLEPVSGTPGALASTPTDTPWPPPAAFVTPARQTVRGALESETDSATYTFDWRLGTAIRIELESLAFDTMLTLQYPDGSELTDDDSAGELDSLIGPVELPADGTYTVRVDTFNRLYGNYTLTYTDYSVCGHLPIVIVVGEGVRLRVGPSTFEPIIRQAQNGECLAIAGRSADGAWLRVYTAYDQTAWISASVVELIGDVERAPVVNP
jgi:serine/threonine protein kinase